MVLSCRRRTERFTARRAAGSIRGVGEGVLPVLDAGWGLLMIAVGGSSQESWVSGVCLWDCSQSHGAWSI